MLLPTPSTAPLTEETADVMPETAPMTDPNREVTFPMLSESSSSNSLTNPSMLPIVSETFSLTAPSEEVKSSWALLTRPCAVASPFCAAVRSRRALACPSSASV